MQFYSECENCIFPASNILSSMQKALEGNIFEDEGTPMQVKFIGDRLVVSETLTILIDQLSGILGDRFDMDSIELSQQSLDRSNNVVIGAFINILLIIALFATWRKRKETKKISIKDSEKKTKEMCSTDRQSIYTVGFSSTEKLELFATDNDDMSVEKQEEGIEINIIPR